MSIYLDRVEGNDRLGALGIDAMDSTFGQYSGALWEEPTITGDLYRFQKRQAERAKLEPTFPDMMTGAPAPSPFYDPSAKISDTDANEQFGIPGHLSFSGPTTRVIAEQLLTQKREELARQDVYARFKGGVASQVAGFGIGLISQALDPVNIAASFLPVVGPARYAAWAERFGTIGARAGAGAIEGFVGNLAIEPFQYALATDEQRDYTMADSLMNVTLGAIIGTRFHVAGGAIADRFSGAAAMRRAADLSPEVNEANLKGSIAAIIEDRPVMTGDAIRIATMDRPVTAENMAIERARLEGDYIMSPAAVMDPSPYHELARQFEELSDDVVAPYMAHGMAAAADDGSPPDASLLKLLSEGLDETRLLNEGPLKAGIHGVDSTRLDAPYILLSDPGKTVAETGIKNIILNGPAEANLAALRQAFPDRNFMTAPEAIDFIVSGRKPAGSFETSVTINGQTASVAGLTPGRDAAMARFAERARQTRSGIDPADLETSAVLAADTRSTVRTEQRAKVAREELANAENDLEMLRKSGDVSEAEIKAALSNVDALSKQGKDMQSAYEVGANCLARSAA